MQRRIKFFGRGVLALTLSFMPWLARAESAPTSLIAQGRQVYIAEGCIHCHSQFVRPDTADVERWGPPRDLAEVLKESPPLLGNRRQGPDLANVGNRRTVEWNRLHLQAPRNVSPGSRMPNYAHLFSPGNARGEALLAYLASLGGDTVTERSAIVAAWQPDRATLANGDATRGRQLFARLCTPCHGSAGRGDGPLAARLTLAPPNWPERGWRRISTEAPAEIVTQELARLIKFGSPATPMAGHETLTDQELAALVALVRTLGKDSQ